MALADLVLELDDLRGRTLEDILQQVVEQQSGFIVRLPKGEVVAIQPALRLKPLPVLEGSVPEGWKDALYGRPAEH